jgi:hypothetical protein
MQQQAALRAVTGKAGTYTALHAAQSGRCRSCRCKKRSGLQECLLQPLQLHVLLGAVLVGLLVLLRWPKALVPWGSAGPERNQLLHSWYVPSTLHSPVGAADPLLGRRAKGGYCSPPLRCLQRTAAGVAAHGKVLRYVLRANCVQSARCAACYRAAG